MAGAEAKGLTHQHSRALVEKLREQISTLKTTHKKDVDTLKAQLEKAKSDLETAQHQLTQAEDAQKLAVSQKELEMKQQLDEWGRDEYKRGRAETLKNLQELKALI